MSAPKQARKKSSECPNCGEETVADYSPFCSKRCADIDLHRWLSGGYAIPAADDDGYDEDGATTRIDG